MSENKRDKFKLCLEKYNLSPPKYIEADGKIHYCHFKLHPTDSKNGWYIFSASTPSLGLYGCFEENLSRIWKSKEFNKMNKQGNGDALAKLAALKKERKKAKQKYLELIKSQNTNKRNDYHKVSSSPPNVSGRKGIIKTMVLEGLSEFYIDKKRLPEKGKAFQEFINFINIRLNQKIRPTYLTAIEKLETSGTEKDHCLTIVNKYGAKKKKTRKYVSSQFYKFEKEFEPNSESPSLP